MSRVKRIHISSSHVWKSSSYRSRPLRCRLKWVVVRWKPCHLLHHHLDQFLFLSSLFPKPLVYESRKEMFLKKYSFLLTEHIIPYNRVFGVAELKHLCKLVSSLYFFSHFLCHVSLCRNSLINFHIFSLHIYFWSPLCKTHHMLTTRERCGINLCLMKMRHSWKLKAEL